MIGSAGMNAYLAEAIGTMILVLLGDGVVANVLLARSKGQNSGWIVITTGWAVAVAVAVYSVGRISGAHINPAVTIALASIGSFEWALVPGYIAAQMIGAFLGAVLVWLMYLPHWRPTEDRAAKLGVFCTGPAIHHTGANFVSETLGTAVLLFGILAIGANGRGRSVAGVQPRAPAVARRHPGARDRPVARRTDRLRDQPRPRPRPAPRPRRAPHCRKRDVGLALQLDPGRRPHRRRSPRRGGLQCRRILSRARGVGRRA
jgi:MIP family channel proteins